MLIFGTRPEAIKLAPVVRALEASELFSPVIAVTAQHRSMLDQVLDLFSITPDFDLNIGRARQSLTDVTVGALTGLSPLISRECPDAVVVQGDTTTTFTAALAAFYHRIPVVHIEAGLRSGAPYSPFPEEINRCLTTRIAAMHLAPTPANKANLMAENVPRSQIVVTGNTVIDALMWTVERRVAYGERAIENLDDDSRRLLLVTAHRRESWGPGMESIGRALAAIARRHPGLLIVFPIHLNPVVRETITPLVAGLPNVVLIDPLSYGAFARLMNRADIILTDSGGIQEEAPSLGKPVLVTRDTTERPEAMAAGTVKLVGTDDESIIRSVDELLLDDSAYADMATAVNPYGDGQAARRTLAALANFFGMGPSVDEFGYVADDTRPSLPSVIAIKPTPTSVGPRHAVKGRRERHASLGADRVRAAGNVGAEAPR